MGDFEFFFILFGLGCLSLLLFLATRSYVFKLVHLTQKIKTALWEKIDKDTLLELTKEEGEVAELARAFGDILTRLEDNIKELSETKKKLYEVITKVGKALASMENFDVLIHLTLETTIDALEAERGIVFSYSDEEGLKPKSYVGWQNVSFEEIESSLRSFLDWVVSNRKTLFIPTFLEKEQKKDEIISPPLVCNPLLYRDKLWGVIVLCGKKKRGNFTEDELRIIYNLSSQMAIAFENFKLSKDMEKTYFETMSALALAVEARDPYSRGHSERVGKYAVAIAKELGLPEQDIQTLQDAARLHDIGKIGISDSILKKTDSLSEDERITMRKHPEIGESIIRPLKTFRHLLELIRHHHEFLDGSGYPDGLKGDQITLLTRILTVADIFDALTTNRPYRKALTYEEARNVLNDLVNKGKIDGRVVGALLKLVKEKKI